jgi:glucose/arabinose dehydrogenase
MPLRDALSRNDLPDGKRTPSDSFYKAKPGRALGIALATLGQALGATLPAGGQTLTAPGLTLTTVTSGLDTPTTMAFVAPGDILVLEKNTGRVRRVRNGVLQSAPVADFAVSNDSERGLLGIATNGENPPKVFLYMTESTSDGGAPLGNRVYRFQWNPGPGTLTGQTLILDLPASPGPNHDGGVLTVDAAGRLYAVIGDQNRNGQLQNNAGGAAPDNTSVILRVNADGTAAAGNPFTPYCSVTTTQTCATSAACPAGQTCRTEVARYFAYGVRNSFGLAIDPVTGSLWDTENGPESYDEVNRVVPGFNSGWNQIMGPDSRDPQGVGDLFTMPGGASLYSDPEFSWLGTIAPTAILFPRQLGAAYDTSVLVGDVNTGDLYRLPLNGARDAFDLSAFPGLGDLVADNGSETDSLSIGSGFSGITDLEEGPDGAVYAVSIGLGRIFRIAGPSFKYNTVSPCRVLDTRSSGGALASGAERLVPVTGTCGVPASARAVAVNVTVTGATGAGYVSVYPGNAPIPATSTVNFGAGQTRANNAVSKLSTDGQGRIKAFAAMTGGGSVHFIIDVAGYFE